MRRPPASEGIRRLQRIGFPAKRQMQGLSLPGKRDAMNLAVDLECQGPFLAGNRPEPALPAVDPAPESVRSRLQPHPEFLPLRDEPLFHDLPFSLPPGMHP